MRVNLACKKHRVRSNVDSAIAKVWVEYEYYLNLESEDEKWYKEKLILSSGELLPDPNEFDVGWKEEVHYLPDLCFPDIFNYLINTPSDNIKENLKVYKSLEAYNFFVCGHVHDVLYHQIVRDSQFCFIKTKVSCLLLLTKSLFLRSKHWKRVSLQVKTVYFIIHFKQYSSLERQKGNKKYEQY